MSFCTQKKRTGNKDRLLAEAAAPCNIGHRFLSLGILMLTIRKLPNYPIWHVESDDRLDLAMTFLRIEEYYESPNPLFQGKVFSLETYMDWYVREYSKTKKPYGAFTYASDWSAFNVPEVAVRAVCETFTGHSAKELWLFDELTKQGAFHEDQFYLIGNKRGAKAYFEHEYRHALFALNREYHNAMIEIIACFPIAELRSWILERYSKTVLLDEIQAYTLTGWPKGCAITEEMRVLQQLLKRIEQRHIPAA